MTTVKIDDMPANATLSTSDATLTIDLGEGQLNVGGHTFELKVVDDSGNQSAPARVRVVVLDSEAPTAVLTVLDERGKPVPDGRIAFGQDFSLDASRSVDSGGGKIVSYRWTLLDL